MKKILFFIFLFSISINSLFSRDPICPPEDYPNIEYQSKESDGVTDLSIVVCLDEISDPRCDGCCITVYYFKRLIPPQGGQSKRVDIMLDYIESQQQTDDCYWCKRMNADAIIELIHKKILEKHADEYGLKGEQLSYNHLVLRAGCVKNAYHNGQPYEAICEISPEACCYKTVMFTMNQYGIITNYENNGQNLYNWPEDFVCQLPDCHPKCGLLAGLNLLATVPKKPIVNNKISPIKNDSIHFDMLSNELIINNDLKGLLKIEIFDYTGYVIKSFSINKTSAKLSINLKELPKGLYFCKIINQKTILLNKFIKIQ